MEKATARFAVGKHAHILNRLKNMSQRVQHISVEECLDNLTTVMYRIILLLGVPYFLFVLFSFLRMTQ